MPFEKHSREPSGHSLARALRAPCSRKALIWSSFARCCGLRFRLGGRFRTWRSFGSGWLVRAFRNLALVFDQQNAFRCHRTAQPLLALGNVRERVT
jgi:hypothetical protein